MSGHKRMDTLRRYLGFGLQLTKEDEAVQDNVEQILLKQN